MLDVRPPSSEWLVCEDGGGIRQTNLLLEPAGKQLLRLPASTNDVVKRIVPPLVLIVAASAAQAQGIKWFLSLEFAKSVALKTGRLLMVDFYSDGSSPSQRLVSGVYTQADVIAASRAFVPVRLNATMDGSFYAREYRVNRFSTIYFLEPSGRVVSRAVGFQPVAQLLFEMNRAMQVYRERKVFEPRLKRNPNDLEAMIVMAKARALAVDPLGARALLERAEVLLPPEGNSRIAGAYNALGDYYQSEGQHDLAIGLFMKAKAASKNPADSAYAQISIGSSYLQSGRNALAIAALRSALEIKGISPRDRMTAERLLGAAGVGARLR